MRKIFTTIIFFASLIISGTPGLLFSQNPTNPGFEDGTTSWTTTGSAGATNARTGSNALSHTTSSTSNVAHTNASTISVAANAYGHVIGWAIGSNASARASCGGTLGGTTSSTAIATIGTTLTRLTYTTSQNGASAQNFSCRVNTRSTGGSTTLYWDDIVMYTSSSATPDVTDPTAPSNVTTGTVTSSSVNFSWTNGSDAGTGVQNTIILRTTNTSASAPAMNDQGQYSVAGGSSGPNSIGDWTILSISEASSSTTFTDNTVEESTSYKYAVIHRDLAYNFSSAALSSTITTSGSGPTITIGSITGFGNQAVNTTSSEKNYSVSGSNLTANITITPPLGFEISTTSGSGYVANPNTLTLEQSGGTVNPTTIYVVFTPTAVTSYSGNITHESSGAATQNVAASGTGTSPANPATFTAVNGGSSQITLSATANANGNNIVVVWDGDGSFSVPTDGVAPGNVGDAFADGTIHYKGAAGSLGNHTGLNSNTAYYYKAFSYDALNYYSSGSTANATTSKVEPSNHPSGFSAAVATPTYSAITVTWADASGTTTPDAYLIKGSDVSYAAITAPVDGTAESDGGLVKNVAQGTQTHTFTGLSGSTTYYFKIYSYTNSGALIDYKTDGTIQQATATTTEAPSYAVGDFGFTVASGNWGTTNANWKQWDGSGWNTTPSGAPSTADNVFILDGNTCVVEAGGKNCKNLTVESNAKLYTNNATMGTPRYINTYGNITVEGTVGNGAGVDDVISFNVNATTSATISGSGSFTANRMRRNSGTGTLTLSMNMDIELRYNGDALYNALTDSPFYIEVGSGKHVNLTGNGGTPTAGLNLKSTDKVEIYGKLTVTGTLTNAVGNTGVVIKSNASGTGSLIHSTSNIKGTAEKYITAWGGSFDGFHFLSSPMVTESIRPIFVPGSTPIGANQDFYQWDELTGYWINSRKEDDTWNEAFETTFSQGKGYLVAYASTDTKYFRDTINVANVSVSSLAHTTANPYGGWHLLGNPFASAISWTQGTWSKSAGIGTYAQVWNSTGASYKVLAGAGIIPAMNGFMVYTSENNGSLTIPANARLHSDSAWYKSSDPEQVVLVAKDLLHGLFQELILEFKEGANPEFDLSEDCKFLGGYAPVFCSKAGQTRLALNTLPTSQSNQQIPLYFVKNGATDFEISLHKTIQGSRVMLTDLKLNQTVNLSDAKHYAFSSSSGDDPNRFILNFSPVGMEDTPDQGPAINIYSAFGKIIVKSEANRQLTGKVYVYNMVGQLVMEQRLEGAMMESFVVGLPVGYYVVNVITDQASSTRKVFIQ